MTEPRQTITVSIDAQDLPGTQHVLGTGKRAEITSAGMLGVANNTGVLDLLVNDHTAVRMVIHEDKLGHAVIQVYDMTQQKVVGVVDIELYGLVPPRRTPAPKRERRFGDGPQA
ncbi:hypothetical protein SEA_GRASSBOY_78 [Microbacterium phage Grassboy]|nr:hypothetical protein SEA_STRAWBERRYJAMM_79 [Microbacterium phage StrawberryJamm]UVG34335.1 hypothetical protein SEA_GRASSBOY_78 [Microbacterium phage Grassboy]